LSAAFDGRVEDVQRLCAFRLRDHVRGPFYDGQDEA
jgi:hypothetical protein